MDVLRMFGPRGGPARGSDHRLVRNSAGGAAFEIDDATRLRRFLTLGVDGGTYYASAPSMALDNAKVLVRMAQSDPDGLVNAIVDVSTRGAAPRQNPALFALAYAASIPDASAKALAALPRVARTGTHLFTFAGYVEQFRGWGRGLRRAVGGWYTQSEPDKLAYQVLKYRQREGWSHRDLLRLAHPVTESAQMRALFDWIAHQNVGTELPRLVEGFLAAQATTQSLVWARLIEDYGLSWEMLPDEALSEPAVWEAFLGNGMPQTALMRQLPRLTRLGLLPDRGGWTEAVCAQLVDPQRLRAARVHPVNVLVAQRTYASGHSMRGQTEWDPSRKVTDALDTAFRAAFGTVEPSGKRLMLAVDVSGSMGWGTISGIPLQPREAAAALTLVQLATEPDAMAVGFTSDHSLNASPSGADRLLAALAGWFPNRPVGITLPALAGRHRERTVPRTPWQAALKPLRISPNQRLDDALRVMGEMPMGGTDCAQPMLHALSEGLEVDTFVVYTDNETWAGDVLPHEALQAYRAASGIAAKLIVVGMTATKFSIADPDDPGMLDIAGFDQAVPSLISQFARGL